MASEEGGGGGVLLGVIGVMVVDVLFHVLLFVV